MGVGPLGRDLAAAAALAKVSGVRIAVAGLVKRGKSTLVNTIIGEELSPVNLFPETSSVLCFTNSNSSDARGVSFDGRFRKLSTKPSAFASEVSREARKPLLAASYKGALTLPANLSIIDTPGAYETEVTLKSMTNSGMPASLLTLCDGFVVVMGVPGVSATDIQLLEEINRSAKGSPVRIVLKGLDSGISYLDLREYASEVLADAPNEIFVVSDGNKNEISNLLHSFGGARSRNAQTADFDSQRIIQSVRERILAKLRNRSEPDEIDYPTRLLKDLPIEMATVVATFARGERERRIALQEREAQKAARDAFKAKMDVWSAENNRLKNNLIAAQNSLTNAQAELRRAQPKMGCGAWVLLAFSCVAFPVGPIIVGAILWFAQSNEESKFAKIRPSIQSQIAQASEAVDRAKRLHDLHQGSKPRQG
jgi:GTPase Era involved in 16S rRNA processing